MGMCVKNFQKERNDSIFLITRNKDLQKYQYKIFGISENNTALRLKFYGDFGSPTFIESRFNPSFPDVITPMKDGKYLFYQQSFYRLDFPEEVLRIDVEEWEKNEDWNRSCIILPFNFTDE